MLSTEVNNSGIFSSLTFIVPLIIGFDINFSGEVDDGDAYFAEKAAENAQELPKIWMACGTEDSLHGADEAFAKKLKKLGYDVTWSDWKGKHDWIFWQECIEKFIPWLPLEKGAAGRSSGNVGI